MLNANVIVIVNPFSNGKLDKNGKEPVILQVLAGKAPNRMVLSGTIAESAGFELGKNYYANVREVEANEYGRQFRWTAAAEITSPVDLVKMISEVGPAQVIDVSAPVNTTAKVEETAEADFSSVD